MDQLLKAMEDISEASNKIFAVISTIEEIAVSYSDAASVDTKSQTIGLRLLLNP